MVWMMLILLFVSTADALRVIQPDSVVSSDGTVQLLCIIQPQPWLHTQTQDPRAQTSPQTQDPRAQTSPQTQDPRAQTSPQTQDPSYPHAEPQELQVSLLKGLTGSQKLCSSILITPNQREKEIDQERKVQCHAQVTGGAVGLTVSGLTAADADVYRCVVEVLYPAPYLRIVGNGTYIHVVEAPDRPDPDPEAQRQNTHQEEADEDVGDRRSTVLTVNTPVVVLTTLVLFVLLLIIHVQILQHRRDRQDTALPDIPNKMAASSSGYVHFV
ncbi:uncharacterized protein cd28 [Polymixia lowei]